MEQLQENLTQELHNYQQNLDQGLVDLLKIYLANLEANNPG